METNSETAKAQPGSMHPDGSASRITVGLIVTTIGVIAMCVAIGLDNIGNGVLAFGIYLFGISMGVSLATSPNDQAEPRAGERGEYDQ